MIDAGILSEDAPVELLQGLLVQKMSKKPPHVIATELLTGMLHRVVPAGWYVSIGNPVTIEAEDSEPEPDVKIVRGTPRDYHMDNPSAGDVALIIEVSATSYATDRQTKWFTYAASGVPVYWILDLNRGVLEVHTDPAPEGWYRTSRTLGPDDEATIELDAKEVARFPVREILP
jgi:Uma2 family endonuclease